MAISMPRMDRLPADERGVTIGDFLVPIRLSERLGVRVRHVGLVIAGALLIALCARLYFFLPGSPVPYTAQTFGVLLAGGALGFKRGLAASTLYIAIGAIGLPVFAQGRAGLEVGYGATGGYLVGFILAAALVGRLAELGWDRSIWGGMAAMLLGSVVIYAVGVPWLAVTPYGGDLGVGVGNGLLPFLVWDAVKLALAGVAFPLAWWFVGRRPGDR
ncbi:MAG: biotin transporter BioY [Chloroflexi bacterium]|nr:biotin transporter BioY [Chloroflexota bacterium]